MVDTPTPPRSRVTNDHLRDLLVQQGERVSDQGRRLDQHIEEDARRHVEERAEHVRDLAMLRTEVGRAVDTALAPFADVLPSITMLVAERAAQQGRDAAHDQAVRRQLDRIKWVAGIGASIGSMVGGAVAFLGWLLHWN